MSETEKEILLRQKVTERYLSMVTVGIEKRQILSYMRLEMLSAVL